MHKSYTLSFVAVAFGLLLLSFAAQNFSHAYATYMDARTVAQAIKEGIY